jgi:NADPH:quinone reductase-like Zn-dependent oxidoreductase
VATTASAKNHELVRSLGVDLAIDYKTTRFEDAAQDQDVVFDTQGGETLMRSFESVKPGGVVVTVGGVPDGKFARAWGLSVPIVWALTFMTRKITAAARMKRVRFDATREALAYVESGRAVGKVVVDVAP